MRTVFELDAAFISFDETQKTVALEPTLFDAVGVNKKTAIRFEMIDDPLLTFKVEVEATVLPCSSCQ